MTIDLLQSFDFRPPNPPILETRATILARQEVGESLVAIASDLEMPYETVKTYAKRARRALKSDGE